MLICAYFMLNLLRIKLINSDVIRKKRRIDMSNNLEPLDTIQKIDIVTQSWVVRKLIKKKIQRSKVLCMSYCKNSTYSTVFHSDTIIFIMFCDGEDTYLYKLRTSIGFLMKIVTYKFVLYGSCVNFLMVRMVLFISCIDLFFP